MTHRSGVRSGAGWWWCAVGAFLLAGCPGPTPTGPDATLVADPAELEDGAPPGAEAGEFDRGVALIKREAFAEAVGYFDKVLAGNPQHAEAEYYRALARERLGEREAARTGYERALVLDPKLGDAAVNLGAMYLEDDPDRGISPEPAKAIAVLSKVVAGGLDDPGVHENLAFAYRLAKKYDQAKKHYLAALKLADSPATRFAYGDMLHEADRCDEAAPELERALPGFADDLRTLVTIADLLGRCRAYRACVKALDRAIALEASDPQWYVRRGLCHHGAKDEAKARGDFEAALKQDPKFAAAYYYLGTSYRADKQRPKAVHAFEQAQKLDRGGPIGKKAAEALAEIAKQKR